MPSDLLRDTAIDTVLVSFEEWNPDVIGQWEDMAGLGYAAEALEDLAPLLLNLDDERKQKLVKALEGLEGNALYRLHRMEKALKAGGHRLFGGKFRLNEDELTKQFTSTKEQLRSC